MIHASQDILVRVSPDGTQEYSGIVTRAGRAAVQVDFHGDSVPNISLHRELEARFEGGPLAFGLETRARITGRVRLENALRYRFTLEPTATRLLTAAFRVRSTCRASPPHGTAMPIEVLPPDGGPAVEATLNDLSAGGLSFYVERADEDRLAAHEELFVRLHLPGETQLLDLELSVLSRWASGELYRYGGKLLDLRQGEQAKLQIEAWVRRQVMGA